MKYHVTVDSAFEGCNPDAEFDVTLPVDPQRADEFGTDTPSAKQLADYYAGEYCDSGTVLVVNTRDRNDRGLHARRLMPS